MEDCTADINDISTENAIFLYSSHSKNKNLVKISNWSHLKILGMQHQIQN